MVLYRDMRTYGFREAAYREAREKGVLFVRYEPEQPPQLEVNGRLRLRVREPALGRDLQVDAGPGGAGRADGARGPTGRSCPSCCACR